MAESLAEDLDPALGGLLLHLPTLLQILGPI
jgi:hypothetical protein